MKVERDNIEFLRAWEDGTWDVESYDCPVQLDAEDAEQRAMDWCNKTLVPMAAHRAIVFWGVYAIHINGLDTE